MYSVEKIEILPTAINLSRLDGDPTGYNAEQAHLQFSSPWTPWTPSTTGSSRAVWFPAARQRTSPGEDGPSGCGT